MQYKELGESVLTPNETPQNVSEYRVLVPGSLSPQHTGVNRGYYDRIPLDWF